MADGKEDLASIRIPKDVLELVKDEKERLRKTKQGEPPSYARLMAQAWAVYTEVRRIAEESGLTITEALRRFAESLSVKLKNNEKKLVNFPGSLDMLNAPDQELLDAFTEVFQRGDAAMKARLSISLSVFQDLLRAHQSPPPTDAREKPQSNPRQPKQGSGGSG